MASTGDELGERPERSERTRNERLATILTDSVTSEIRRLTAGRERAIERAQAHRRDGQLVPASLCEDMAENDGRLRRALERYTALTAHRT
jgi:hypothetical protein